TRATHRSSRRTCCRAPPPRSAPPRDRAGRTGFRGSTAKKEQGAGSGEQGAGVCRSTAPRSLLPAPIRFPPMPISLSRRRFLVGTAGAIAAAALGDGFLIEPVSIDVTRHAVPIPGLAHELAGSRIACTPAGHLHRAI